MATAEYTKRVEGNTTVFEVTPAKAPKFWTLVVIGALCILGGLASLSSGFGIFWLAMGGFCFWYGWSRDPRPKAHKAKSTFRVSPDAVEGGGRKLSKDDIHRLMICNGITDEEIDIGAQVQVTSAMAAGMAHRAKIGTIANGLTVESGGKATLLAGGMDKTTAFGLLTDASKILGFKYQEFS